MRIHMTCQDLANYELSKLKPDLIKEMKTYILSGMEHEAVKVYLSSTNNQDIDQAILIVNSLHDELKRLPNYNVLVLKNRAIQTLSISIPMAIMGAIFGFILGWSFNLHLGKAVLTSASIYLVISLWFCQGFKSRSDAASYGGIMFFLVILLSCLFLLVKAVKYFI